MTEEWKEFSPLVEYKSDSTLTEVQEELVAGGRALQNLLTVEHPNADAVRTSIQAIKDDLDFEGISNTWVIAHVRDGQKDELVANKMVRQVSLVYRLFI